MPWRPGRRGEVDDASKRVDRGAEGKRDRARTTVDDG